MATGDLIVCSNSLIYFLIFLLGPVVTGGERGLTSPRRTDTRRPRVSEANGVSKYVLIDDVHVISFSRMYCVLRVKPNNS